MNEILLFSIGASISGTIFLLSLLELILTIKRRRTWERLKAQLEETRAKYATTLKEQLDGESHELEAAQEALEKAKESVAHEKEELAESYEKKIDDITSRSTKELDAAQAKAKKLEQAAKIKAEEYLASRTQEVEEELMSLVLSVTKKVLPQGLTYEVQKELVMKALRDVRAESGEKA